ncbi:ParA family protein [Pleionea sp. CnH1-48]|uniref:ParA family protein n=1 Tax=Pleionea sp. CnH1-48 TaxID=2954494 RepID=UPI00209751DB|nr:ParA family protein [Pleionea sp. CnH1-48]MCO7226091.1 ParA family protein [Pleionea sp. CnH1-48]
MKIWTVANQKGGVGKTTSVVTLGGLLAEKKQRVLLIDCDPHASLTSYLGYDCDAFDYTLYNVFEEAPKTRADIPSKLIQPTEFENLSLISSSLALATLDKRFSQRPGMGLIIKQLTQALADEYDYVLLDCPPILGVLLINALAACEQLVIPVQTEFLAIKGLDRMMQTLNMVIKAQHHNLHHVIVPTMFDRRTKASVKSLRKLRDDYEGQLWPRVIPVDTKFRDASQAHTPPHILFSESHGVEAYRKLLKDLMNHSVAEKVA